MKKYLISSERAHRRNDERDCVFITAAEHNLYDVIILDGLRWVVTEILQGGEENDRG